MGGCGLAAWSQLAISKALEITLEGHRAERTEGRAWVSPRRTLTIPMYPLPHPPERPLPPHSPEPHCQQGSGRWWGAASGSCPRRDPPQGRSGATWPLADGSEGVGDACAGGSRPLLGRGQYRLRAASSDPKSRPQTHSHAREIHLTLFWLYQTLSFPPLSSPSSSRRNPSLESSYSLLLDFPEIFIIFHKQCPVNNFPISPDNFSSPSDPDFWLLQS